MKRARAAVACISIVLMAACAGVVYEAAVRYDEGAWNQVRDAASLALLGVAVASILLLRRLGAPFPAPKDPWNTAPGNSTAVGSRTVSYEPVFVARFARRARWFRGLIVLLLAAHGGLVTYLLVKHDDPVSRLFGSATAILFALAVLAMLVAVRIQVRWYEQLRLDVSDAGIRITWARLGGSLRRTNVPWRNVYWDGLHLLVGRHAMATRNARLGDPFERAAFEQSILARVPPKNVVDRVRMLTLAFRARNPVVMTVLGMALLILVLDVLRRTGAH